MILLVRHAHAGDKHRWPAADDARPLSATGREEAVGLVRRLGGFPIDSIVSSPALRCVQTVDHVARQRDMGIGIDQRLRRTRDAEGTLGLLAELDGTDAVLCTHGETIGALFAALAVMGVPVPADADYPKGSTWLLDTVRGAVTGFDYLPPLRVPLAAARSW